MEREIEKNQIKFKEMRNKAKSEANNINQLTANVNMNLNTKKILNSVVNKFNRISKINKNTSVLKKSLVYEREVLKKYYSDIIFSSKKADKANVFFENNGQDKLRVKNVSMGKNLIEKYNVLNSSKNIVDFNLNDLNNEKVKSINNDFLNFYDYSDKKSGIYKNFNYNINKENNKRANNNLQSFKSNMKKNFAKANVSDKINKEKSFIDFKKIHLHKLPKLYNEFEILQKNKAYHKFFDDSFLPQTNDEKKNFKIKTLGKNINENPSRNNLNNVNIAPNINVEVNNNGSNIDFNKIWTDIGNRLNAQLNASIGSL